MFTNKPHYNTFIWCDVSNKKTLQIKQMFKLNSGGGWYLKFDFPLTFIENIRRDQENEYCTMTETTTL